MRHLNKICLLPLLWACALEAQQGPYSGISTPPPDNMSIEATPARVTGKPTTTTETIPGTGEVRTCTVQPAPTLTRRTETQPAAAPVNPADMQMVGDDANAAKAQQMAANVNPNDMKMVEDPVSRPHMIQAAQLPTGTRFPVVMITDLNTDDTQPGKLFKAKMSKDITSDGKVVIPRGSEVRGRVTEVQSGPGERTMMRLRPDTVILPDGSRYQIHASVSDPRRDNVHLGNEGEVVANEPVKHDAMVYGGTIGSGAIIGAVVAGPPGALVGAVIGAGAATTHAIFRHNRVSIPQDSSLELSLTEPMDMVPTLN